MSGQHHDEQIFDTFFLEEGIEILGIKKENHQAITKSLDLNSKDGRPKIPSSASVPEKDLKTYWRVLRSFFQTGVGGGISGAGLYPALLAPFRDVPFIQSGYPLWVADDKTHSEKGFSDKFRFTLSDLLRRQLQLMAPADGEAKILKDNLPRLERILLQQLGFQDLMYHAEPVFRDALDALVDQLQIKGSEGEVFRADVEKLKKELPRSGVLVPYSSKAAFFILSAFLKTHHQNERQVFREEVQQLILRLKEILAVEREKSPEAHSEEHLHATFDFASTFLRFEELAEVLPVNTEDAMPAERLQRIEKIIDTLNAALHSFFQSNATLVVSREMMEQSGIDWQDNFPGFPLFIAKEGVLCEKAQSEWDAKMVMAKRVFAAFRLGKLELENNYRPEIHADFFAHFDWRGFSEREMAVCPNLILLADSEALASLELNALSRMLSSNRPIKIFGLKRMANLSSFEDKKGMTDPFTFRNELGALAIAHRNTFVHQSAVNDPDFLMEGLKQGFSNSTPALYHWLAPASFDSGASNPYIQTSAGVEGREFPSFCYNSEKGPKWGSRFDISANPAPQSDWTQHPLLATNALGEVVEMQLVFTFADYAALQPAFQNHFQKVPPKYWNDELIPLPDYLQLHPQDRYSRLPFIWMLDADNVLQKIVVDRQIVLTCMERLDFWHYLQENAGIHSYHVEQATQALHAEITAKYESKMLELETQYQAKVEKVREETARRAMEQLAATLLDMDTSSAVLSEITSPVKASAKSIEKESSTENLAKTEAVASPAQEESEPDLALGEVWIETPLCTTCNECINLNKKIFQYNAEKQAFVANPKGGPFSDIVKAAENCPVKIIHPGVPFDKSEPDLDQWIKRAEPFN